MNALGRSIWLVPLAFALACGGGDVPPATAVAPTPAATVAPAPAVAPAAEPVATTTTSTTSTTTTTSTTSTVPKASGPSCCKTDGDWGDQWSLGKTEATCDGAWVSGKECDKVCCSTNGEQVGWRSRGSCRQFGMWESTVVDAGQCKGLGLDETKTIGVAGGGELVDEEEDELLLEDLDAPPVRTTTGTRARPLSSGSTKTRPK